MKSIIAAFIIAITSISAQADNSIVCHNNHFSIQSLKGVFSNEVNAKIIDSSTAVSIDVSKATNYSSTTEVQVGSYTCTVGTEGKAIVLIGRSDAELFEEKIQQLMRTTKEATTELYNSGVAKYKQDVRPAITSKLETGKEFIKEFASKD